MKKPMMISDPRLNPKSLHRAVARRRSLGVVPGWRSVVLALGFALLLPTLRAEIPTVLTDKIYKGSGVVDLLKDVTSAELLAYLQSNENLLLGIDLNEAADGMESRDSVGIAIKQVQLTIQTAGGGLFTFSDFFTNTSAMIREAGSSVAEDYFVAFGTGGSNALTGGTTDFTKFDDVIQLSGVSGISGTITSAKLSVTFLRTADTGVEGNEAFFDFSNGFEELALLTRAEATAIEQGNFGIPDAPAAVTFSGGSSPAPAAPAPPGLVLAALGGLAIWRARRGQQ